MEDKEITKEQLTNKLVKLSQRIAELEKSVVEYQQVEESLRESEEKFRTLVEMASDCIHIETVEGCILECNTAGAKMFGYTKEEMIGLTIANLVPEEFAKKLPKVVTEKEATQGIFVPRISKKKDDTLIPVIISTAPVIIDKKPQGTIGLYRDITERKHSEQLNTVLYNISKVANSDISLDRLYPIIHKELGAIIDTTNFFIALFSEKKDKIFFPYYIDERVKSPVKEKDASGMLSAYIEKTNKSLLVNFKQIKKMVA